MNRVAAGDTHCRFDYRRTADEPLADGGLLGRQVPPIIGADPPLQ
jgi:hypothetical protein